MLKMHAYILVSKKRSGSHQLLVPLQIPLYASRELGTLWELMLWELGIFLHTYMCGNYQTRVSTGFSSSSFVSSACMLSPLCQLGLGMGRELGKHRAEFGNCALVYKFLNYVHRSRNLASYYNKARGVDWA